MPDSLFLNPGSPGEDDPHPGPDLIHRMVFDSVISQGTLQTRFGPFQTEIYASSDLANCCQFYPIHRMNLSLVRFQLETRSGMLVQMLFDTCPDKSWPRWRGGNLSWDSFRPAFRASVRPAFWFLNIPGWMVVAGTGAPLGNRSPALAGGDRYPLAGAISPLQWMRKWYFCPSLPLAALGPVPLCDTLSPSPRARP